MCVKPGTCKEHILKEVNVTTAFQAPVLWSIVNGDHCHKQHVLLRYDIILERK